MNDILNNKYYNHHLNESIYKDCLRLLKRIISFTQNGHNIPTDEMNMRYFGWSKDRINRCYQMLKELKVVTYSRNHRRTTLEFLGEYKYLNDFLTIKKKAS